MTRSILLRLGRVPPVVLGVLTLLFLLLHLAPGDPASLILAPGLSQEVVEQLRANYGLDQPLVTQYLKWIGAALTGDLGWSVSAGRPVTAVIGTLLPQTILLVGVSLFLAFVLGIAVGSWQALRAGKLDDSALNVVTLFFHSMPSHWLAVMMVLVFSLVASQAGWPIDFPASGTRSVEYDFMSGSERFVDRIRHMVLPVATLTLVMLGGISRHVRSAVLEVSGADHVRAARARGLSESVVLRRHVLRNAMGPVATLFGIYLPLTFGGAVFVETIFAWPGMGRALVTATNARDYPLVLGVTLVVSVFVVLGNLLADLVQLRLDPRVRRE